MDLPLKIDKENGIPVYVQAEQQIRLLVHQGVLLAGDPMPTVRELAVALGVNSNTITRVYRDLQAEGLLVLRRGVGTFISENAKGRSAAAKDWSTLERKIDELMPLCRRMNIEPIELFQLIEKRWSEK